MRVAIGQTVLSQRQLTATEHELAPFACHVNYRNRRGDLRQSARWPGPVVRLALADRQSEARLNADRTVCCRGTC